VTLRSSTPRPFGPPLIGALLRGPWEVVHQRLLDGLHERGFTDLGPAHLLVLQWPTPDGLRPSELAAQARMTKQAMNYLLGNMEQAGYLTRAQDPDDRRSRRIRLTGRGHAVIKAMREIVREVEADWERELGAERFAELRTLLGELRDKVCN
jgi:DNA-binding MarR family transcriptional regulator